MRGFNFDKIIFLFYNTKRFLVPTQEMFMNFFPLISSFVAQTLALAELQLAGLQVFSGNPMTKKQMAHTSVQILKSLLKQLEDLEAEAYKQIESSSEEMLGFSAGMLHVARELAHADLSDMPEELLQSIPKPHELESGAKKHHQEVTAELATHEEKAKCTVANFFSQEIGKVEALKAKFSALF